MKTGRIFLLAGAATLGLASGLLLPRGEDVRLSVAPPAFLPAPTEAPAPRSVLLLPVEISAAHLRDLAERELPTTLQDETPVRDGDLEGRIAWHLRRDASCDVTIRDGSIHLALPISFRLAFNGEAEAFGSVRLPIDAKSGGALTLRLSLRPNLSDGLTLETSARVDFSWRKSPVLDLLGLQIGIEGIATEYLRQKASEELPRLEAALNEQLGLRQLLETQWGALGEPIRLAESPDLWLSVRPQTLLSPTLKADDDMLRLETGLEAYMKVGTEHPLVGAPSPLTLSRPSSEDSGFHLRLPVALSFDVLGNEATRVLSGESFEVPGAGTVAVRRLEFFAHGDALALKARIEGVEDGPSDARVFGDIFLEGTPRLDKERGLLRFEDLQYDENTSRSLLHGAAWLLKPLLLRSLQERLVLDVREPLEEGRRRLQESLGAPRLGDDFRLSATLASIELERLQVSPRALRLVLEALGDMTIEYDPQ